MKNIISKNSLKFMLAALITMTFNYSVMATGSLLESNNQNTSNNSSGQLFDNSSSNSDMWGSSKSTMFNESSSETKLWESRQNAPALPDEPGATCVPVPDGTLIILIMAFLYGLVVLFLSKRKSVNTDK